MCLCCSSRPLTSEWRDLRPVSPVLGMRREWRSVDTFLSVQPSYPSDWGLPRLTSPGSVVTRLAAGDRSVNIGSLAKTEHNHHQKVLKSGISRVLIYCLGARVQSDPQPDGAGSWSSLRVSPESDKPSDEPQPRSDRTSVRSLSGRIK